VVSSLGAPLFARVDPTAFVQAGRITGPSFTRTILRTREAFPTP
jgi:hypothetical protein